MMFRQQPRVITLALALVIGGLGGTRAWAQNEGTVRGVVRDATGGVLAGVTLTATHQTTKAAKSTTSATKTATRARKRR